MNLTEKTLARMNDVSRVPTDEASAIAYKILLQNAEEMDLLESLSQRHEAGEDLVYEAEVSGLEARQRAIHVEFVKRHPQFPYACQLSYRYDQQLGQPQMVIVDAQGDRADESKKYDLVRDALVHEAFALLFKNHMMVFDDGSYEFCWEQTENSCEVTYKIGPDEGQSIH